MNLILLTKKFPFTHQEQYIGHELPFLCKAFEKVFIYPHDHFEHDAVSHYELPQNAQVINLNASPGKLENKLSTLALFVATYCGEFFSVHSKSWFFKNTRYFYHLFITQSLLAQNLFRWLKKENIKSPVFYSYWFSKSGLCLSIMKKRKWINRYVSRAHALDLYHEDWIVPGSKAIIPPFRNFKLATCDTLFAITEHGRQYLLKKNASAANLKVSYLGVFDKGLNPGEQEEKFVIVTCCGLDERRRINRLAQALLSMNLPVKWIHFGDGPQRTEIEVLMKGSAVEYIFKGQTKNEVIRDFYSTHRIDLFINLSTAEGLPVAIMEALSHGIPVLATAVYGTPEAVKNNITGSLLPAQFTQEELQKELNWFYLNRMKLNEYRKNCRQLFQECFDASLNYSEFARQLKHT